MSDEQKTDIVVISPTFDDASRAMLAPTDYDSLKKYIDNGGKQLAVPTAGAFFELFLNGSDVSEIHRLNKAFPVEAIHWARVKYNWDVQKEDYIRNLQLNIKDKLMKAQMETVGLLTDMLTAANKKHGDKLKRFIQTGNEKDLAGALSIDSVHGLLKVVEGIQKITGADKVQKISKEETLNVNVTSSTDDALSAETASKILAAIAEEKRKR